MKEYRLFKTAKKTAKENGLILADGIEADKEKRVLDFSLLGEKKLKNKKG